MGPTRSPFRVAHNLPLAFLLLYLFGIPLLYPATTRAEAADGRGDVAVEVVDFGPIKQITAPSSWRKSDHSDSIKVSFEFTPRTDEKVAIGLLFWRPGIDRLSSTYFKALITDNADLKNSRVLFDDRRTPGAKAIETVKSLTRVLGMSHAGDNQITNPRKPPDPQAPVFHLGQLELQSINGITVLFAEGYFMDIHGKPKAFSSGIYVPYQSDKHDGVYQVYLQAPDEERLRKYRPAFQNTMKSILWKK